MAKRNTQLRRLFTHEPILLDGAVGTELERRGVPCPPPAWSAAALRDAPGVVESIHRAYVAAGADLIVANTFRTNPRTLRQANLAGAGAALNRLAIGFARAAAAQAPDEHAVLVAASVAPVEDCYHPERVPPDDELHAEHAEMMDWLAAADPDLVWIETMNTAREARAAALAAHARGLPFAVSFVVREDGNLLNGDTLEAAVATVESLSPLAIGINCIPPRGLTAMLPRLRQATALPLAAYAHVGNARPVAGWSYAEAPTPAEYAEYARQWVAAGATIVGGCCGTTPSHIKAVAAILGRPAVRHG